MARRFVSVVGAGGVGKTTVAISAAHAMTTEFEEEPIFLDLGSISDPALVARTIAVTVNVNSETDDPLVSITSSLANRNVVLIFDNCEHVIDQIAPIAQTIVTTATRVHILATSREALRTQGEYVYRLDPLSNPVNTADLTAEGAITFPTVQLLVECASVGGNALQLTDDNAPFVAAICNKLDGLPLAIEHAASRVIVHGPRETATLLGDHLSLEWRGPRTAVPRHQSVNATLDWSYRLLPEREKLVLQRLSIFVGPFCLKAAQEVASDAANDKSVVAEALAELIAKSLVLTNSTEWSDGYRLLETTRAYAIKKLTESGELDRIANRHASYFVQLLQNPGIDQLYLAKTGTRVTFTHLGNVRAALNWCFSSRGIAAVGVRLVANATRLFIECSLFSECVRSTIQALSSLPDSDRGTSIEMDLQEALAISLTFTQGDSDKVRAAIARGLVRAEQSGDGSRLVRMLAIHHFSLFTRGDIRGAMAVAEQRKGLAHALNGPVDAIMADLLLGFAEHLLGNQRLAQKYIHAGLTRVAAYPNASPTVLGRNNQVLFFVALARTLWLQGFPERALSAVRQALDEEEKGTRTITKCISLIYAASVFIWCGDQVKAHSVVSTLIAESKAIGFIRYEAAGIGLRGEILVREGQTRSGIEHLRCALRVLHRERYNIPTITLMTALAEGLMDLGQLDNALIEIDRAQSGAERDGIYFSLPEVLRVKGDILWKMARTESLGAESYYLNSLHSSRSQGNLSWELRTSRSLAKLMFAQGRANEARRLLSDVYGKFTEGFATRDLEAANSELSAIGDG
jgi:predicted ATPase